MKLPGLKPGVSEALKAGYLSGHNAMYALIGRYDLAFIVDMPSNGALMKVSIAVTKLTGIGFSSMPAMTVEEFDDLAG